MRGRASPGDDCKEPSVEDLSVSFQDHPVGEPYLDAKLSLDSFTAEMKKLGTKAGPNWQASRKQSYDEAFGSRLAKTHQ